MNILIVSQYFWPENFRVNDLAVGLKDLGHSVTVLTGKPNYPEGRFYPGYNFIKKSVETYNGITVYRVPLFPRGKGYDWMLFLNYVSFAFFASLLGPLFCRKKYDVIFVFEVSPVTVGFPAIVLKKIKKAPIFLWVLDLWPESLSSSSRLKSRQILNLVSYFVRYIYKQCDKILVSSKGFIPSIKKLSPSSDAIVYFPNFIEETISREKGVSPIDELYKFPPGFIIMFAGNIGYSQSFPTILKAAEILKCYKDIHWIILGDGRMAPWVKKHIEKRGIKSNFHMLGRYPQETMPYFFLNADAMLVALKHEPNFELTIPGKIQSYLASGKPVIASLNGEGANLISDAKAGIACPAEDADALAAAVLKLYNLDEKERVKLGHNGREYCLANFDRAELFSTLERWMKESIKP